MIRIVKETNTTDTMECATFMLIRNLYCSTISCVWKKSLWNKSFCKYTSFILKKTILLENNRSVGLFFHYNKANFHYLTCSISLLMLSIKDLYLSAPLIVASALMC